MPAYRSPAFVLVSLIPLLALVATPDHVHADELTLRRYEPIEVYVDYNEGVRAHRASCRYRYMDAADTHITPARPDANFGRSEQLLIRGADDRILIEFGRLYRAIPPNASIGSVELLLTPVDGRQHGGSLAVHRVLKPWRDGGGDGTAPRWATTYQHRFAGDPRFERPWSPAGPDADCADAASFENSLDLLWNEERGAYVLRGAGLTRDVQTWLERHYRNYGWMIRATPTDDLDGPIAFHSSDAFEAALRPTLRITYTFPKKKTLKPRKLPDLDVTYIERVPRYTRYNDNGRTSYTRRTFRGDRPGIMNDPDYDHYQKHPKPGDLVTFIAHVKNASDEPYDGPLTYTWTINDEIIKRKTVDGATHEMGYPLPSTKIHLAPWEEFTTRLTWEWKVDPTDHRKVVLEFEVDPEQHVDEISEHNNAVRKYVAAKTLKFWVERSAYDYVKDYASCWGTFSYEDYLQWHIDVWNETYFDKSRFDDFAPDGCLVRATLDDFQIVPDGFLGGGIHRPEDTLDPRFDGEWGTEWAGFDAEDGQPPLGYIQFLQRHRVVLEPSLLHEMSHQVWGAYDIYWSNIECSTPTEPRGKCKIKDESGYYITRGDWYLYGGLMGGDDTRPNPRYWEGTNLYSANSVGGANTNARFRNGFYGEWQYDLPRECRVQLLARDGTPLQGATITLWQQTWKGIINDNLVAENVPAGPDGIVTLPNQSSLEDWDYTILTGHTLLKQNPWGRIDVVGQNITMLMQVNAYGQRDYRFVRVLPFNRAFWSGHTDRYTLPLECRISPSEEIDFARNVAHGAKVVATKNGTEAKLLTDGDVTTRWRGGQAEPGDIIEITLPQRENVGIVQIVQDAAHGQFFRRFKILVQPDQNAPWEIFDVQQPEPFGDAMGNEKDTNNERPSERWVTYAHTPLPTRTIRIEALDGGGTDVSEIRVFAEK